MLKSEFDSQWEAKCNYLVPRKSKISHVSNSEKSISLSNLFSRPCLVRKENINYEINCTINLESGITICDSPREINYPM